MRATVVFRTRATEDQVFGGHVHHVLEALQGAVHLSLEVLRGRAHTEREALEGGMAKRRYKSRQLLAFFSELNLV